VQVLLAMRARLFGAIAIQSQRMLGQSKTPVMSNAVLTTLDFFIVKFFHQSAIETHQVIMVGALVELKDRLTRLKVMPT
jgi:hypothetical protein